MKNLRFYFVFMYIFYLQITLNITIVRKETHTLYVVIVKAT